MAGASGAPRREEQMRHTRMGLRASMSCAGVGLITAGVLAGLSGAAAAGETVFVGVTPCRAVDTRGNGFAGPFGPPSLAAGVPRDFPLAGQCAVPAGAQAVSLNVTATNTQGPGFFLLAPAGGAPPLVSTLNYVGGETVANAALVPLGAGALTVIAGVSGADLIVDVNGYFVDLGLATPGACPPSMVRSGPICIDKYEASVWETTDPLLVAKIRAGAVTLAELQAAGAVQHGTASDDYGTGCPDTGNGCVNFYAVSIPGVTPSRFINWFQAVAVARNAGKRLPTNQEWQAAALGTPDPGASPGPLDCNTSGAGPSPTGSRANCLSNVGAFDMVGNLWEWVADWVPRSTDCPGWAPEGTFSSDDRMCLAGADTTAGPGALVRGGYFNGSTSAGVFAVFSGDLPSSANADFGFRAAR
jgi:sulfatase-modifying factor enzyme 1